LAVDDMDFDTPNVQAEKKAKKNKSASKSPRKKRFSQE